MSEGQRNFATLGEYSVEYRQWGSEGPAVMLIHGIPMTSILFKHVGPLLAAAGYRVFAPGQMGLSYTDGPMEADHSLVGQAEIMTRFAEDIIGTPFVLFGHDLGGGIAQIMVTDTRFRDRIDVTKIVIGNSAVLDMWPVPEANAAIDMARAPDALDRFTPETTREMVRGFAAGGLMNADKALTQDILDDIWGCFADDDHLRAHFIEYLKAMDNRHTVKASPLMAEWTRPALLLWAIHDPFQPPYVSGVALAQIMHRAKWAHLDASHFYPLEVPEEVARIFIDWDREG